MASKAGINIQRFYATHVVEVKVNRRNAKLGYGPTRRFLCTNSPLVLDTISGRSAFHFKAPVPGRAPFNATKYNLVTVFDLLMQDYRNVNLDSDTVVAAMPVRNVEEVNEFWHYFAEVLSKWSSSNKQMFQNT